MRPITSTLRTIDANVKHLVRHAPTADRQIRQALSVADGYPASTGLGRKGGVAELTSVEAAADRRLQLGDTRSEQLRQLLEDVDRLTYRLVVLVNEWLPAPERSTTDRCSGGGSMDGALDWGRPDCTNIGSSRRSGLCDACWMRYARWRSTQGGDAA